MSDLPSCAIPESLRSRGGFAAKSEPIYQFQKHEGHLAQGAAEFRRKFETLNRAHAPLRDVALTRAHEIARLRATQAELRVVKAELKRLSALSAEVHRVLHPTQVTLPADSMSRLARFTTDLFAASRVEITTGTNEETGEQYFVIRPFVGQSADPERVSALVSRWHDYLLDNFGEFARSVRILVAYK